jgi:hypothetical protein
MRTNQFICTNDLRIKKKIGNDFFSVQLKIGELIYHKSLNISLSKSVNHNIIILGLIINPFNYLQTTQEIADDLSQSNSFENLLLKMEGYSGRFVILSEDLKNFNVFSDFTGMKQVYYFFEDKMFYLSSSDKLLADGLGSEPIINDRKRELIDSSNFLSREYWFFTEEDWDDRFKKLLPNHYLDIIRGNTERIPIQGSYGQVDQEAVEDEVIMVIQNSVKAILNRSKNVFVPLTAGMDSRILAAASYKHKDVLTYFTFERKRADVKRDVKIARKIAKLFDLTYKVFKTRVLTKKFIEKFKFQFIVPRILSKTENIQYYKDHNMDKTIVLMGIGELTGGFFPSNRFTSPSDISCFTGFDNLDFQTKAIEKWFDGAKDYSDRYQLEMSDLFYQEIRLGKWASSGYMEHDYAGVEIFDPFNNKRLTHTILFNIPREKRCSPDYQFNKRLITKMNPQFLNIPFNPKTREMYWDMIKTKIGIYKKNLYKN